jgi:hypothetical protein
MRRRRRRYHRLGLLCRLQNLDLTYLRFPKY